MSSEVLSIAQTEIHSIAELANQRQQPEDEYDARTILANGVQSSGKE